MTSIINNGDNKDRLKLNIMGKTNKSNFIVRHIHEECKPWHALLYK